MHHCMHDHHLTPSVDPSNVLELDFHVCVTFHEQNKIGGISHHRRQNHYDTLNQYIILN